MRASGLRSHLLRLELLAFAALAPFYAAHGADAAVKSAEDLECRWAETPPVLDGRGDDAVWKHAAVIENFALPWKLNAPIAKERTAARLLWDREAIYFLAEMEDSDVVADVRQHDGPLWQNDVFELFFRPSEKHAGYFEFEVNPAGAVFDAFFPTAESWLDPDQVERGAFHVSAWSDVRGTLNRSGDHDTGWTVEGRIPWTDFLAAGGRPAPGETWRVNLARVNGAGAAGELSATAPLTKPSFHRTHEFSPLRFTGPEPLPRGSWENTRLTGSPDGPAKYAVERLWPRLKPGMVVGVVPAPEGEWIWFIEQKAGADTSMKIRRFRANGDGSDVETLLEGDEFAYSIAFHPRFAENGYVFIGANGPQSTTPRYTRVVRYTVRDGRLDAASRVVIIEWSSDGHNGAALAFANDGTLFVTSGDGTTDSDTELAGQETRWLRAKILRIDVDHPDAGKTYAVPKDNPFVVDGRFVPETWAYGLRNPWRLSFDAASGQLWVGENGQDMWEMARLVERGANYGWSHYEGSHPFRPAGTLGPQPVTFPTIEHGHNEFRSLTGGVVYRGKRMPELVGAYVYGDHATGRIWAAKHDGRRLEWQRELCDTPLAITQIIAGPDSELLVADYGTSGAGGAIYRLQPAPPAKPAPPFPIKLSETGLFATTAELSPASGVVPYEIAAPGWHDGATSAHLLALPCGTTIDVTPAKSWTPPDGTTLAQTLSVEGRRLETRVLVKQQNDWAGYSYVWNAAGDDALLADMAGAELDLAIGQPWHVPSRAECMMCHSRQAGFALTLHEAQLNVGDQLARWERLGLLKVDAASFERDRSEREKRAHPPAQAEKQRESVPSPLLPRNPDHLRHFIPASDIHAGLEARARSYLGANCAHCHTEAGGGNSPIDFDWLLPREAMHALGANPFHGDLGIPDARIIAPGAAARSVLVSRASRRGPGQMPPVGTRIADPEGVRLLVEWIESLGK